MSKDKSPIFDNQNYGVSNTIGVTGILSRLWRTVLLETEITPGQYDLLLREASTRARQLSNDSRLSKTLSVANLRRELDSPSITWKVFVKGLRILRLTKITLAIKVTHSTGVEKWHSVDVDLGGPVNKNEFTGV